MNTLKLNSLELDKTYSSGCIFFDIGSRIRFLENNENIIIYCDRENDVYHISFTNHKTVIDLESYREALEIEKYTNIEITHACI